MTRVRSRSGFGTALVTVLFLLLVAPFLGSLAGCAWNPLRSEAREAQKVNEAAIVEAEAAKLKAEQDRAKLAAAVDQFVAGTVKLDDLADVLGADAVAALKADAQAKLAKMRDGLSQWDALIQANADALAGLYTKRTELVEEVKAEDAREDAGLDIADALIGAGSLFLPGLGLLRVATGIARKRGAASIVDSIDELRRQSPELDAQFGKLDDRQKRAAHILLEQALPKFKDVIGLPTR